MYTALLILLVLDSLLLVGVVLLQAGQGGGMAATFGGVSSSASTIFGARQAGNLLTKLSWWCGGVFLGLAFILALMSTRNRAPRSILEDIPAPAPAPSTAPPLPAPTTPINPSNAPTPPIGTKKGGGAPPTGR